MNRTIGIAAAAAALVVALAASAGAKESKSSRHAAKSDASKEMNFTAEVVDLNAYVMHSTVPSSMDGSTDASPGPSQYGLLISNALYVPIMKDSSSPATLFSGQVGKSISVTGVKREAGGTHFLVISPSDAPAPTNDSN